jgi:hypothetical protein
MTSQVYGPAGDEDTQIVYLFLSLGGGHYGLSEDRAGSNLPRENRPWNIVRNIALGVKEALPFPGNPEPALAGLKANGFYVWHPDGREVLRKPQDDDK